jgi:hypothetical protein
LDDEDIAQAIQLEMTEMTKGGLIKASDVVDAVASPRLQELFKQIRISKLSISPQTAQRWLCKLGWHYGWHRTGLYVDGHEHPDVIKYRCVFIDRWVTYEDRFHLNEEGFSLLLLLRQPTPGSLQAMHLILVTYDKSTFYQNDKRKTFWGHSSTTGTPTPKGEGYFIMVSDFLTAEWGSLWDEHRCTNILSFITHN